MKGTIYQFVMPRESGFSAWSKAPADVAEVLRRMGAVDFVVPTGKVGNRISTLLARLRFYARCCMGSMTVARHSVFVLQYPEAVFCGRYGRELGYFFLRILLSLTGSKLVTLIHDLEELRLFGIDETGARKAWHDTLRMLSASSCVIAHNERMIDWFVSRGVSREKLVSLEVFDYLVQGHVSRSAPLDKNTGVVIAGALNPAKAGYIATLPKIPVHWHLFGKGASGELLACEHITYHGAFPPDELPDKLDFGFGLVWDGTSADGCRGSVGEYQRYNNSHRLSLCLAAGIPVFIWKEAAEAKFVTDHGVGVAINSLRDIPQVLTGLTVARYQELVQNAIAMSEKTRKGYFVETALSKAMERIGNGSR